MASFTKVGKKWRALVRKKGFDTRARYFETKAAAVEWAATVEAEFATGIPSTDDRITVGAMIREYRKMREASRPIADTSSEHYQLRMLEKTLGEERVASLTPDRLKRWALERKKEGAGAYTVNIDLGKLGTALRYSASFMRVNIPDVVQAARPMLSHLGLIGGGGKRERRPTEDEFQRLLKHLREGRGQIYADAVEFAARTAMRRGEITDLLWKDLDEKKRVIGCWRKHPRKAKVWEVVPILTEAWEVVKRLDRSDERLFPIHPQTLSKYFRESCKALGIVDLHFHDLRHEGTSALFEEGFTIEQVALVTGHKSWNHLKRYTNLKPEDLHKLKR